MMDCAAFKNNWLIVFQGILQGIVNGQQKKKVGALRSEILAFGTYVMKTFNATDRMM